MKKTFFMVLVIFLIAICESCAMGELSTPANVNWKEGSSATATWDSVENTNYSIVDVHAYYDSGILGNIKTSTISTEIDVQQEIHQIVGSAGNDNSNNVTCILTVPENAHVGESCNLSYEISGGSGNYSNIWLTIGAMGEMGGGSRISAEDYQLDSNSGTFTFVCPAGSEASIMFNCHDDITGEDFWTVAYIPLDQNPNFPVTFTYDKEEYYIGDSITVNYVIGGNETTLTNSRVLWGIAKQNYSPDIPVESQDITSLKGSITYKPTYGDYVRLFLQAEDVNGNIIFGQTKMIRLKAITADIAQRLPESLIRIEEETFSGTAFLVVEIPTSVTYIDEHAFDNCNIRLIVGHSDYVRDYAARHNIAYVEK